MPAWGWAEHWGILKCLITGRLIDGSHKEELFACIRQKTGMKYVFGFNSGQEAICAALTARRIGPEDRVILPSYCCETVAQAVSDTGSHPLFCDIGDDYNPDVDHIFKLIDPSVKAIIVPHLFGKPSAIDKLEEALEARGIRSDILVIDDAAQSFGAKLNGKLLGTFGDAGIISLGPGKTMTACGGGLLITNSDNLAKHLSRLPVRRAPCLYKFRRLLYWVIFRRWRKLTLPFYPFFRRLFERSVRKRGSIIELCNVDAAIALHQLKKLDSLLHIRISRKKVLDDHLSCLPTNLFSLVSDNTNPNRSLNVATKYLVRFKGKDPAHDVQRLYSQFLSRAGIEIQDLYLPIHHKPAYVKHESVLPKTEMYCNAVLQLPLEPSIRKHEFAFVIEAFDEFIENCLNPQIPQSHEILSSD